MKVWWQRRGDHFDQTNEKNLGFSIEPSFVAISKEYVTVTINGLQGIFHGQVARDLTSHNHKKKNPKQALATPSNPGLEPLSQIIQGACDAPWISAWVSNTGPRLGTPGGTPLC